MNGERESDLRVRIVPSETAFGIGLGAQLGELAQEISYGSVDVGVAVELDTRERTRAGESRGGAAGLAGLWIYLQHVGGAAVLEVMLSRMLDTAVTWLRRNRDPSSAEETFVIIFGPDGKTVLRHVHVHSDGSVEER